MVEKKSSKIYLKKYIENSESGYAFGNDMGRKVFQKLLVTIASCSETNIFAISMEGIKATDASFPRESVISLAKVFKGEKGICLYDFSSEDILDNWKYAAQAKEQPLIVILKKGYQVIGPQLTDSSQKTLDYVMSKSAVTSAMVADAFDISSQNASARLKNLFQYGLVLGQKETAETGGLEFVYKPIK